MPRENRIATGIPERPDDRRGSMCNVRSVPAAKKLAACFSDIHFSHTPPGVRTTSRQDWYRSQKEFCSFLKKEFADRDIPILVAGDLLEHWDEPAELINFLIDHMPHVWAVAGNHDLPNHQLKDIERSAYWTLVQAGKVTHLFEGKWVVKGKLAICGYSYGTSLAKASPPPLVGYADYIRLALVHSYVWSGTGTAFPGVSDTQNVRHYRFLMKDRFDVVLFGDNHIRQSDSFTASDGSKEFYWCNPGPIFRRTVKEKGQLPVATFLMSDGTFEMDVRSELDALPWRDDPTTREETEIDFRQLVELLRDLGDSGTDYVEALLKAVNRHDCRKAVRNLVREIAGELRQMKENGL